MRDVEALLEEALGEQVVGKSTVARICQDTRERYRAWCQRRHPDPAVLRRGRNCRRSWADAVKLRLADVLHPSVWPMFR